MNQVSSPVEIYIDRKGLFHLEFVHIPDREIAGELYQVHVIFKQMHGVKRRYVLRLNALIFFLDYLLFRVAACW